MQSEHVRSLEATTDSRGKHRISAELKRVEQEARFLEEEVEQLNEMGKASEACKETSGPENPSWDRWFEGPPKPSRCKCWIF